jgi:hypothetical protein
MSRWHRLEGVADLPDRAFSGIKIGGRVRITLEGGGGGETTTTSTGTTTSYQSNLPEYAKPYYQSMMARAQNESVTGFTPYDGQRIADFSPGQEQAHAGILGMDTPEGISNAGNILGGVQTEFTPDQAAKYMSPYQQGVIDVEKREAARVGDIARNKIGDSALQSRAFGGGRHGVVEAELNRGLINQLGDIQTRGSQQAYDRAASQFGADRNAQLKLAGAQKDLAKSQQGLDSARLNLQNAVGADQRKLAQQHLDKAFDDFVNKRDFERQQISFLNSVLRGIDVGEQREVRQMNPAPSGLGQIAGAGLGALGAYNAFKG